MAERSQLYTITLHHSGSIGGKWEQWFADSDAEVSAILGVIFTWDHETMRRRITKRVVKDYDLQVHIDLHSEKPWT